MVLVENLILDEYDYLVYIAEQCIKKGFDFESYNTQLPVDECEVCKLQHFALRIALLDAEILSLLCTFEKQFWGTSIECEDSYRDFIDLQLNHKNIHVLNLN